MSDPAKPRPTHALEASPFAVGSICVEVMCADVSAQLDVDALAILTNPWLMPVGPAAQAVHRSAGKQLEAHCRSFAPIDRNDVAFVTDAFELPNKALLHCCEPIARRHPMYVEDLTAIYRQVLLIADERAIRSLALEPLGGAARLGGVWSEAGVIVESIKGAA